MKLRGHGIEFKLRTIRSGGRWYTTHEPTNLTDPVGSLAYDARGYGQTAGKSIMDWHRNNGTTKPFTTVNSQISSDGNTVITKVRTHDQAR